MPQVPAAALFAVGCSTAQPIGTSLVGPPVLMAPPVPRARKERGETQERKALAQLVLPAQPGLRVPQARKA